MNPTSRSGPRRIAPDQVLWSAPADGRDGRPLVTMTDVWLSQHTRLIKKTYRGLGHSVSEPEITDLADF